MSSSKKYNASSAPFIRRFTLAMIKAVSENKFCPDQKICVHADLVPKVSERVMMASLGEREIPPQTKVVLSPARQIIVPPTPSVVKPSAPPIAKIAPTTVAPKNVVVPEGYGRLIPLLHDPSVAIIESPGPGKQVTLIRSGRRQMTRISLSKEEILEILETISDKTHIPLFDGVFHAAVDNFTISAVISDMVGSKFVIKKLFPPMR